MTKPAWLLGNVVAGLQDLVATLDAIVADNALDAGRSIGFSVPVATGPAPSPAVPAPLGTVTGIGNALVAIYNAVPLCVSGSAGIDPSLAPAILATARAIGTSMAPASAYAAFSAAVDALPDAAPSPTAAISRQIDAANGQLVARLSRLVLMGPYAEAIVRQAYASRQDGVTARADCVERTERELDLCFGAPDADVAQALADLRNRAVDYLSQQIATLAPVVTVAADTSLPSIWWAWRLYGDPTRAGELVARNSVAHPSFMPLAFDALAPSGDA